MQDQDVAAMPGWLRSMVDEEDDNLVGETDGEGTFNERLEYPLSVDPTFDKSD